jgi:hypothetical protein
MMAYCLAVVGLRKWSKGETNRETEAIFISFGLLMNAGYDYKRVAGFWRRVALFRDERIRRAKLKKKHK